MATGDYIIDNLGFLDGLMRVNSNQCALLGPLTGGTRWRLSTVLNVYDHRRDSAGLTYVYPVVSRRAGGVSVGINLNVNNACNWACVYCQVPGLTRGGPPPVNLDLLEEELRAFLNEVMTGNSLRRLAPPESRRLVDVAFSGNGEPTSSPEFAEAVERVGRVLRDSGLLESVKMRLITNGSLMHRTIVQQGVAAIGQVSGEVWFKIDRATEVEIERINGVRITPEKMRQAILRCAELAPTWVQTCYFAIDGAEICETERSAYLAFIASIKHKIKGVHLYGLARPSMQPDAKRLSNLSLEDFRRLAGSISSLGIEVVANP